MKWLLLMVVWLSVGLNSPATVHKVGKWPSGDGVYADITTALRAAVPGDEIWVSLNDSAWVEPELFIPAGVSVYGGFAGGEESIGDRDFVLHVTILDGRGAHRVATVSGVLDGFTLRNGRTGDNGGGVLVKSGGLVDRCIVCANEAGYNGGGVFAEEGAVVKNTLIYDNRAGNDGAAMSGRGAYTGINTTAYSNSFTALPVIADLDTVLALDAGGLLDLTPPAVTDDGGSAILLGGWELGDKAIPMPCRVTFADNGKKLRYWAVNAAGVGVSAGVAVTVRWVASFRSSLRTPPAVCAGTSLRDAGLVDPDYGPETPDDDVKCRYFFLASGAEADTELTGGLDYELKYEDNGKLLVCRIYKGAVRSAESPAVRVAVMKKPEIYLPAAKDPFAVEDGERLCLPLPYVASHGAELTLQGWEWSKEGTRHDLTSCDKVNMTMDGARISYAAANACGDTVREYIAALSVPETVGEFTRIVSECCDGVLLKEAISFNDGGRGGNYTIDGVAVPDFNNRVLTVADNLKILKYSYNEGRSERRMTLTVLPVPSITLNLTGPADTVCHGTAQTLALTAAGENRIYQWQRKTGDGFTDIAGETESRLQFFADADATVRCFVSATCVENAADKVTVNEKPVLLSAEKEIILAQAPGVELGNVTSPLRHCEETPVQLPHAELTLTENRAAVAAAERWWTLGGQKVASTYPVKTADNGKPLGYRARNRCGETVVTFPVTVQVDEHPVFVRDPADAEVQMGSNVRLSARAAGSGTLSWRWQKKMSGAAGAFTDIAGAASDDLSWMTPVITDITVPSTDTTYRCIVTTDNTCASSDTSATANVRVLRTRSNITIVRQPAGLEQCQGAAPADLTVEITGTGHFFYKWYRTASPADLPVQENAIATAALTDSYTATAAGTYYCVVTGTDDATGIRSQQAVVTVYARPSAVVVSPEHSSVCEGGTMTLGVSATGDGLTYQWYKTNKNTGDVTTGATPVAGATFTTCTPLELSAGANYYYCQVTGKYCAGTETRSPVATITVNASPAITAQPASQSVCGTTPVTLQVTAVTDLADGYTWYCNAAKVAGNAATLSVAGAGVYTCEVFSRHCGSVMSAPALITVAGIPEAATGGNTTVTACRGEVITLPPPLLEANGSLIVTSATGWYDGNTPAAATLTVGAEKTYQYKISYKCSASAATLSVPVTALPVFKVSVNEAPVITQGPLSETICTSDDFNAFVVTTAAGALNLSYQWYRNGAPVALSANTPTAAGVYYGVVSNACGSAVTSTAILRKPGPLAVSIPGAVSLCEGTTATLGVTVTAGAPASWAWKKGGAAIAGATSSSLTVSGGGRYTCTVTDVCGNTKTTGECVVTLKNTTKITTQPAGGAVCDASKELTVTAAGEGTLTYKWLKDGAEITAATAATYTVPAANLGTHSYQCEVGGGCGTALSAVAVVNMAKKPAVTLPARGISACVGDVITLPVVSVEANGSVINPAKSGWVNTAALTTLINAWKVTGTTAQDYKYKLAYTCGAAAETSLTMDSTLTVTPATAVSIRSRPADQTVCGTDQFSPLSVTADGSGTLTYKWYKEKQLAGTSNSFQPTAAGVYHCVVSGACGSAASSAATLTKHADLDVKGTPASAYLCPGTTATLGVTVTAGTPRSYAWTKGGVKITGAGEPTLTVSDSGTYVCTVTDVCGKQDEASGSVIGIKATRITTQPEGGEVCDTAKTLTLVAEGETAFTYKWRKDGALIPEATAATYTVPAANIGTHSYQCEVQGTCNTLFSAVAMVKVAKPPVVSVPTEDIYACVGEIITLPEVAVEANGSVITDKRWLGRSQYDEDFEGNTFEMLNYWVLQTYQVTYKCAGQEDIVRYPAMKLQPVPVVVVTKGLTGEIRCKGTEYKELEVQATGNGNKYAWFKDNKPIETGMNSGRFRPTADGTYHCIVSNNKCNGPMSGPVEVRTALTTATIYGPDSICPGTSVKLDVRGDNPHKKQEWFWNENIPMGNGPTLMVHSAGTYTCRVIGQCDDTVTSAIKKTGIYKVKKATITQRNAFTPGMTLAQSFDVTPPGGDWYVDLSPMPPNYPPAAQDTPAIITYKCLYPPCEYTEATSRLKMKYGDLDPNETSIWDVALNVGYDKTFMYNYRGTSKKIKCVMVKFDNRDYIVASTGIFDGSDIESIYKLEPGWVLDLLEANAFTCPDDDTKINCINRQKLWDYKNMISRFAIVTGMGTNEWLFLYGWNGSKVTDITTGTWKSLVIPDLTQNSGTWYERGVLTGGWEWQDQMNIQLTLRRPALMILPKP